MSETTKPVTHMNLSEPKPSKTLPLILMKKIINKSYVSLLLVIGETIKKEFDDISGINYFYYSVKYMLWFLIPNT